MIFALTVARNELDRYLRPMIGALSGQVAAHFVFDDQSTDGTGDTAGELGCVVVRRGHDEAAFDVNEGLFRQAALTAFERTVRPEIGDWVFSVDADEIATSTTDTPVGVRLRRLTSVAADQGLVGVNIPIPEVWDQADGQFFVRVDGWWGRGAAPRLFAWQPAGTYAWDGHFPRMGCPPVPTYVTEPFLPNNDVYLLHLGYMREQDRRAKAERYAANPGLHQAAHVRSILSRPELVPLIGNAPVLEPKEGGD